VLTTQLYQKTRDFETKKSTEGASFILFHFVLLFSTFCDEKRLPSSSVTAHNIAIKPDHKLNA